MSESASTPLVTIGIPCYNSAKWIRQAVESALAQDWPATEVIVVDDGSTDGSREILEAFGDRIRLFHTHRGGAPKARNRALHEARGAWLQFLDADDYLEPGKISSQFKDAGNGASADVLCSPFWYEVWRDGKVHDRYLSGLNLQGDPVTEWILWELPQTGGALWRKSALDAIGGWKEDQPCCQEHELYLRAIEAGLRFVFTPSAGAAYRLWSEETLCRRDPSLVVRVKSGLIDCLKTWMNARSRWTSEHQRLAGRACFEMARTTARYDLNEAAAYARERRQTGLFTLDGPAAPASYRLAYRLLGFRNAERLAQFTRGKKGASQP